MTDLRNNDVLVERLAAEHALGTLRGGARRRLEQLARGHPPLQRALERWRRRLDALLELLPAEQPPYAIWRAIETRLGLVPPPRRNVPADTGGPARWFANLNFWRGWSIAATAVAVLALVLAVRPLLPGNNPTGNPGGTGQNAPVAENRIGYVAVLNDQQSRAMMLVTWDDAHSQMTVRRLFDTPDPADKSMELWGLPSNGNPVALGVLPPGGEVTLKMAHRPQNYPVLAISVEPKGGSPNPNGPTGPVIFTGKLVATT